MFFKEGVIHILPVSPQAWLSTSEARFVWNAYSVFPSGHFDVHAVFYLIVDTRFFLPSVAITIKSLTTPLHLQYSFHLELLTQSVPAPNLCVCVWIFTCKKRGRASGMQGNIFTTCNPFEDNSSLLLRCVFFFFFFFFAFSERNSKLIFKVPPHVPLTHCEWSCVGFRISSL